MQNLAGHCIRTFRPHRSKIWPRFSRSNFSTNFRPVENVPCVNKAWDTNNEKQEYKGGFPVKHNSVYLLEFQCRSRVMCLKGIYLNFFLFSKRRIPTAYFAAWTFMIVIIEVGFVILLAFTSVPATTCCRSTRAVNVKACSISSTNSIILNNSSWNKRQILGESLFYEFISFLSSAVQCCSTFVAHAAWHDKFSEKHNLCMHWWI